MGTGGLRCRRSDGWCEMTLTGKQKLFVEFYCGVSNGNALDAARRSGYSSPHPEGARLLQNATVQAAIKEKYSALTMETDEVLSRLAAQARATLADVTSVVELREDKTDEKKITGYRLELDWKKLHDTGLIHQVAEVRWTRSGPAIKLHDVQGALDKIAKALGIYKPDGSVEIINQIDLAEKVDQLKEMSVDELSRLHRETLGAPGQGR
jgi:phage terminase small subunit